MRDAQRFSYYLHFRPPFSHIYLHLFPPPSHPLSLYNSMLKLSRCAKVFKMRCISIDHPFPHSLTHITRASIDLVFFVFVFIAYYAYVCEFSKFSFMFILSQTCIAMSTTVIFIVNDILWLLYISRLEYALSSIYLSIYPSIHLISMYLSIYLSIYL